ncbi:MAG: glycosyltransferase, partial [Bacteroidales bacterium]|nr:glycosyltransferase [Bacteroidales bacterium]
MNSPEIDISVVIPLYNEEESLVELTEWIRNVMEKHKFSYEILLIDDGSTDQSWEVIESLKEKYNEVHGIKFFRNYGKAAALHTGFSKTKGRVVITMDADLQDSP